MEQTGATGFSGAQAGEATEAPARAPSGDRQIGTALAPRASGGTCRCGSPGGKCTCAGAEGNPNDGGAMTPLYVYAVGRIEPRFPRLAAEKEFAQATGRTETAGLSDRQALHRVLSQAQNRYLVRQLCWVLMIEGLETYILHPRDPVDLSQLIEALRPTPSPLDVDVVIGVRGPIAPPELCNGLMVPIVVFDQLYAFDREALVKAIPKPEKVAAKQFEATATELLERILQMADNAGATDEHRALNYCAVRYPAIYATTADAYGRDCALTGVEVRPSWLSGARKVVDVIFSYTHRQTDVTDKYFCRVDVTEEFPFLVTKLSPYYDR
jgi:cyclic patellamide precursor peptide PatG